MSLSIAGPGDSVTWMPCGGHPNDPRTEEIDYCEKCNEPMDEHEVLDGEYICLDCYDEIMEARQAVIDEIRELKFDFFQAKRESRKHLFE